MSGAGKADRPHGVPARRQTFRKPDRTGRSGGRQRRRNPPSGPSECGVEQWAWMPMEMLASPAWRALGINARRIVERLLVEHMHEGGMANGELAASYGQFVQAGVTRRCIADALAELEAAGIVTVRRRGCIAGENLPNFYRLTWIGGWGREGEILHPTNEWKARSAKDVERGRERRKAQEERRRTQRERDEQ